MAKTLNCHIILRNKIGGAKKLSDEFTNTFHFSVK